MATFSFADLQATFPQLYRELVPQIQRKVPLLRLLPCMPTTTGQNVGWDVTFSGQAAAAVNSDGGQFITAASDPNVAATLAHGSYSAPIQVTTKSQYAGAAIGSNGYEWLKNQWGRNLKEAVEALVKYINQQLYSGTGSSNQMVGLSSAIAATGSYAGIAQSSYSNWAAYSSGNGGALRNLTLAMIKTATSTIATNSPFGRPDIAICPPAIFNAVENLFDAYTRINFSPMVGPQGPMMSMPGNMEKMSMNPQYINTVGGRINADGFRCLFWENQKLWFVEDPDCVNTAVTNTTNVMYFLNSGAVALEYLPPADSVLFTPEDRVVQAMEADMGPLANLVFDLRARGRSVFADQADLLSLCTLKVKSRNACGLLFDIQ